MQRLTRTLCLALTLSLTGCLSGGPGTNDPGVIVRTDSGTELGVNTDFGLVFLGNTQPRGEVQLEVWFQDGLSQELATVEPVGGGLYLAEPEIRLPKVAITFELPEPGTEVEVVGRDGEDTWSGTARVARNASIEGMILDGGSGLRLDASQIGAAVYLGSGDDRRLLGLVSGRVELTASGATRSYLSVSGPEVLWRLVSHKRNLTKKRRWVYRDDVL